jgi:hypothetical protein
MSSITIPTPYAEHGLLYISSGYVMDPQKPAYAIRPGASGDISLAKDATQGEYIAWCQPKGAPYNPSTLVYGPHLYVLLDSGLLNCYDAKTGAPLYQQKRLADTAQAFTASPWAYEGKVFCLSEDGDAFVVRAGPSFELLGKSSLGEMCMATPAISRGALYIRTLTSLYKIAKPKA